MNTATQAHTSPASPAVVRGTFEVRDQSRQMILRLASSPLWPGTVSKNVSYHNRKWVEDLAEWQIGQLRRAQKAFRYDAFLSRLESDPTHATWLRPDGIEMTEADWHDPDAKAIGLLLEGVFVVLNALELDIAFTLPSPRAPHTHWTRQLDTAFPEAVPSSASGLVPIAAGSSVVFVG